ncbi:hypothetical protein NSND_62707 [Nitrospira sp. ND1]|nr:hypothetical protein NSND_62707 [Nitrospira sp. ND1]
MSQENYRQTCSIKFMADVPTPPAILARTRLLSFPSLQVIIRAFLIHSAVPAVPFCDSG